MARVHCSRTCATVSVHGARIGSRTRQRCVRRPRLRRRVHRRRRRSLGSLRSDSTSPSPPQRLRSGGRTMHPHPPMQHTEKQRAHAPSPMITRMNVPTSSASTARYVSNSSASCQPTNRSTNPFSRFSAGISCCDTCLHSAARFYESNTSIASCRSTRRHLPHEVQFSISRHPAGSDALQS